jgi:parallel beta-helix repeat protein
LYCERGIQIGDYSSNVKSNDNLLTNNTISNNEYGLYIYARVGHIIDNIIRFNTFEYNTRCGINIYSQKDVEEARATRNKVYLNNFIYNTDQAHDNGYDNRWDTSTLGNYWTDYFGVDFGGMYYSWDFTGKHMFGNDGVGDTIVPHMIDEDSGDYYPLIRSSAWIPTADAGPDQNVSIGDIVSFSGIGSWDLDGWIVNYTWDFGGGNFRYGMNVTYSYPVDGIYMVTLTVTDNDGFTGTDTCNITVSSANEPPVAIAGPDQSVNESDVVQFDGSASYQPNGTIESYQWDFDADFDYDGDGNKTNDVDAVGPNPTYVYGDDGVYNVTLTVKSPGAEGEYEKIDQDVVFCVDTSGSMSQQDIDLTKQGLNYYVDEMSIPDQGAVVLYGGTAYLMNPLTDNYVQLKNDIANIPGSGGNTPMGDAMNISVDEILLNGNLSDHVQVIILLTDGIHNAGTHNPIIEAYNAASHNITIYTIGLGPSVNEVMLMQIAAITGGNYYYTSDASSLISIYQGIAQLVEYPGGPRLQLTMLNRKSNPLDHSP